MKLRNILFAAGAALALSVAGASAQNHHGGGGNHGGGGHSGGGHASHSSGASFHGSARSSSSGARSFNGGGSFHNSGRGFSARGGYGGGHGYIDRGRVVDVFRSRHIRYIGEPYFYDGYYVARCYGPYGRLEYCRVNPYSGAFIGFSVRL